MQLFRIFIFPCIITVLVILLPNFIPTEVASSESQAPGWNQFLIFGTFFNDNMLYLVLRSAKISLIISLFALGISMVLSILTLIIHFYLQGKTISKIIQVVAYFPRLLFLILFCAIFRLHETSQLYMPSHYYLIAILGLSGAIFLLSQTLPEVELYQKSFFVYFSTTLPIPKYKIFFTHILQNTYTFPLNVAKQMRDNIMFIAILPFTGVIHLQPEDIGGLIHKYFMEPKAFNEGWWILFFPCLFVTLLVLLFDFTAHKISQHITKQ